MLLLPLISTWCMCILCGTCDRHSTSVPPFYQVSLRDQPQSSDLVASTFTHWTTGSAFELTRQCPVCPLCLATVVALKESIQPLGLACQCPVATCGHWGLYIQIKPRAFASRPLGPLLAPRQSLTSLALRLFLVCLERNSLRTFKGQRRKRVVSDMFLTVDQGWTVAHCQDRSAKLDLRGIRGGWTF